MSDPSSVSASGLGVRGSSGRALRPGPRPLSALPRGKYKEKRPVTTVTPSPVTRSGERGAWCLVRADNMLNVRGIFKLLLVNTLVTG